MSWRDQLLRASFRGVPFSVKSAEVSGGRRVVKHEIPNSEEAPGTEDMGRKGRDYPLEGFVVGDDYMRARDALIAALETEGPGELIHPYYGALRVVCPTYRFRETVEDGRMATFQFEFSTTSEVLQPVEVIDSPGKLTASAASLKTSAAAEFLAKFDELSDLRDSVTGALTAASDAVGRVLDVARVAGQTAADLSSQVADLESQADALFSAPDDLVTSVTGLIESLGDGLLTVADSLNPLAPLLELFNFDPGERPPENTPAREVERQNFDATQNLIKRVVLAQASLMAIEQTFTSYEQAVAVRVAITDLIDQHAEETADDIYPALQQLRSDLTRAVPSASEDLPRLVNFTPHDTTPSLVLTHRLYGKLDREADVIRRNGISNPSFVAGGVELEVLSE